MTQQLELAASGGTAGAAPAPSPHGAAPVAYDGIRAINWSSLRHMAVSPLLYKWRLEHPEPDTASLVIGSAIHCALLEPGKYDSRFAVYDGVRRGKAWEEWQKLCPDITSIKPDEHERVHAVVKAIRAHRIANRLLDGCRFEESTTWTDPETGLACKGRLDAISPRYVVDLKSSRDVMPRLFSRSAAERLYHGQLAWYADGAKLAYKLSGDEPPYIIAAQSDEPFDCAVFQLSPETLAAGRALYRSLLRRLVICLETDMWPGVAPDLELLQLPAWADVHAETEGEDF